MPGGTATVQYIKKRSQPWNPEHSNPKRVPVRRTPPPPQSQSCDDSVTRSPEDNDLFQRSVGFLVRQFSVHDTLLGLEKSESTKSGASHSTPKS